MLLIHLSAVAANRDKLAGGDCALIINIRREGFDWLLERPGDS